MLIIILRHLVTAVTLRLPSIQIVRFVGHVIDWGLSPIKANGIISSFVRHWDRYDYFFFWRDSDLFLGPDTFVYDYFSQLINFLQVLVFVIASLFSLTPRNLTVFFIERFVLSWIGIWSCAWPQWPEGMDFLFVLHEVVTNTFKMATGTKEMKTSLKNARECIKNKEYKEAVKHCKVNIQLLPYVKSWYVIRPV